MSRRYSHSDIATRKTIWVAQPAVTGQPRPEPPRRSSKLAARGQGIPPARMNRGLHGQAVKEAQNKRKPKKPRLRSRADNRLWDGWDWIWDGTKWVWHRERKTF